MSKSKVQHGWFYFKMTDSGNLIGEYANEYHPQQIFTESSQFTSGASDIFRNLTTTSAKFDSAWMEPGNKPAGAKLEITRAGKVFTLKWSDLKRTLFDGRGSLCDGILIGEYHSS